MIYNTEDTTLLTILKALNWPYKSSSGLRIPVICPFHEDKHFGNAFINTQTLLFYCFSCKKGANIYQFIARVKNIPVEAVDDFIRELGIFISKKLVFNGQQDQDLIVKILQKIEQPEVFEKFYDLVTSSPSENELLYFYKTAVLKNE